MDLVQVSTSLVLLVLLALAFDFMNGFHDAANSIATVVSTRVLRPHYAVAWASFFNFVAFLFFGLNVANTIGTGVIDVALVDVNVILGALTGAIVWNAITWWYGLPSSSSHALIGGLVGAAIAKGGVQGLVGSGLLKISFAIVLSPLRTLRRARWTAASDDEHALSTVRLGPRKPNAYEIRPEVEYRPLPVVM